MQNTHADIIQVIHDYMSDPGTAWRIGEQAVFVRDADEEVEISLDHAGGLIVSEMGAVRIAISGLTRLVPAEGLTEALWIQAGLLCLRDEDAGMAKRTVLTELGVDMMAAKPINRLGTLFDLGRGDEHADFCLRTADEGLCELLRAREGKPMENEDRVLSEAIAAVGADYVVMSRLGRIESFGRNVALDPSPNPAPPSGYTVCLSFDPPRPTRESPFDEATYGAFRVLYGIFADPELVRLKQSVVDAVRDGAAPETVAAEAPEARAAVTVLLRQLTARDGSSETLRRWRDAFER